MNTKAVAIRDSSEIMEDVVARGNLEKLTPDERTKYYMTVCQSAGLNPATRPLEFIKLSGRLVLYARRDATDQLRKIHGVSTEIVSREMDGELYVVHVRARDKDGRTDEDLGAVNIGKLQGEARANAILKGITKAKRRVTLSICGLGFLDETEVEDIPEAKQTLPKKDSRDIYSKMQAEIDSAQTDAELRQWGEEAKERIAVLPLDWQDHLRLRFQERLVDLRQHGKKANPMPSTDSPSDFIKWAGELLATATTQFELEKLYNDKIAPVADRMFPPDAELLLKAFRDNEMRFSDAE